MRVERERRGRGLTKVEADIPVSASGGDVILFDLPGAVGIAGLLARVEGPHAHCTQGGAATGGAPTG
jgi:hypothetical protein